LLFEIGEPLKVEVLTVIQEAADELWRTGQMLTNEILPERFLLLGFPYEAFLQKLRRRGSAHSSADVSEHEIQREISDDENKNGDEDEVEVELMGNKLSALRWKPRLRRRSPLML
jgi:hypothetical protein